MGRTGAWLLGIAVACVTACNAIVGVQDVSYKGSQSGGQTGDDDGTTGDDDTVVDPPVTNDGGGGTSDVDSGPVVGPVCNGAIGCERLVFVTHASFNGNLGGTDGADATCTAAANAIPGYAGRKFKAYLSDLALDVKDRLVHGTSPYRRIDRSLFANSWTDIVDGTVNLPLFLDETGQALTGAAIDRAVWTASKADGTWTGNDCNSWAASDTGNSGSYGDSQMADGNWSTVPGATAGTAATVTCDQLKHLYCFEL